MDYEDLVISEVANDSVSYEVISSTIQKSISYIKRYCNIKDIPEGLDFIVVDMSVSLINSKYPNKDDKPEVKSKTMGDTSITYNTITKKEFSYAEITKQFSRDLNSYRKLRW